MLDELIVELYGSRYIGHVWADPGPPPLGRPSGLRWRFALRGHVVAEFPATPADTAEMVRARLCGMLDRIGHRGQSILPAE